MLLGRPKSRLHVMEVGALGYKEMPFICVAQGTVDGDYM
jgi:hypothetical protein